MAEVITRPVPETGPFDAGQRFAAGRDAGPPAEGGEVLSPVEHHVLFHEWCDTAREVPLRPLIHEMVEERARLAPQALAVADGDRRIDYGELDARANGLAHRLQALGVGPETRVALLSERSIELVLGELAVLKAGGGYVPIDPRFPRERRDYMLEDSRAAVVLVHPDQEPELAASPVPVIRLRADEPPCAAPPPSAVDPRNLCYVIYTSGSTGRPKGTEIEHASLLRLMHWHFETYGFAPGERATFFSGPSFDVAVWEVWSCLAAGASLHIPYGDCRVSAPRMIRWLADEGITHGVVSTPLAELMISEPWPAALPLRTLTTGGDRLHQWPGPDFPCPIYNIYGPTEGTIVTSCFVLRPGAGQDILPPIGQPLANVRVHILDPDFRPVRSGESGELWIGGGGVARGYLERPELTAEKFVPDPFADERREPGARMYRSGDLARYLPDGNLEFLGRVDFQMKIRGFRIEPGEIEGELLALPGVREAAILPRDGGAVGTRLVAYLSGTPAPDDHLRDLLGGSLPDYMVPAAFVWLDALPLTPNGKVDRRELAAIPVEFASSTPFVAARTPVEAGLAALWAELLGREAVGVQDDFFLLGGHSLMAVQVLSRIRDLFGVELELADVFDCPTVEELALAVERYRARQAASPAVPALVVRRRDGEIPLSFAQQRLWFLERLRPGTPLYNMPMAYRLVGVLHPAALAAALAEIVRRHEALRTRFAEGENGPVQSIAPPPAASLPQVDLGGLPPARQDAEEERLLAAEAQRSFDLERGPLFRALLLRRAAADQVLMLSMHHIVADGWSLGVLLRELAALYGAAMAGEPSPLPEPAVQYADFTLWQREWLQGEALERELAYWRERLAGRPAVLELPTDRPRPTLPGFRGATEHLQLDLGLAERLRALGWETGTPLSMTLLAGFLALLGRYTGQTDLLVGTPTAGRNRVELEGLIGFFVNTLVLRTDASGDPSFRELLGRVRETALGAYAHADLPFERLVEALAPERDLKHTPLFQVIFSLQAAAASLTLAGLAVEERSVPLPTAKFDLALVLRETADGGIEGDLEYHGDLFAAATARRMLDHLRILLAGAAAEPAARLSDLPLLDPAERRALLVEWNATATEFPAASSLPALFAERARRAPGALAVTARGEQLTYAELDARSDRLAARLRAAGVRAETPVALCAERSPGWVTAMLAVLKAGGAYVPLDPDHPPERLTFLLADSGAPVLLAPQRLAAELPAGAAGDARVVLLDGEDGETAAVAPGADLCVETGGDQLACVIYTSGSTGRPKGVGVTHRAVLRLVRGADYLQIVPGDRVAQTSSALFDVATFEVWGALLNGATLAIVPQEVVLSPSALTAELDRLAGATVFLTTALFNLMAREAPGAFASLGALLVGGEALDPGAVQAVLRDGRPRRLLNAYGPAENTTFSTWFEVDGPADITASVPIGRPIANSRAYVLDAHLQPVPVGVRGSLYVGGAGLARGYVNRPALTAERFVPDPFAAEAGLASGSRLYATGDLARLLADGNLEFLGRADQQVKIRGFRIELGEIEAVLTGHPAVAEAAVLALAANRDQAHDKRLVAYVVASGDVAAELRDYLRAKLPDYMVPAAFVRLESLPLTPNGKVDRNALAKLEAKPELAAPVAPRTGAEQVLAEIFGQVFSLPAVGVHDDFFALGGHSLLATQVVARVRRLAGIDLEIRDLFEEPTIEQLARRLEAAGYRSPDEGYAPPRTPLEALLAEIWGEVLGRDRIGLHDDFWALGGRPPLAAEVVARVNDAFGIALPAQALVEAPSIARFTTAMGAALLAAAEPDGLGEA